MIFSGKMTGVTLCQATPGKLNKMKTSIKSIPELRKQAAELTKLPEERIRLLWQGNLVSDGFDVSKLTNSLVMIVPMAPARPAQDPAPELVNASEEEIQRFRVAFGSAIRNPAFSKVVKRMALRENMDNLSAACPGLGEDLVAQAFLTRPELLIQLLDLETLKKIGETHPALCEAAHNLAAAVHEEQASSGRSAASDESGEPEPGSYFLDELSDEEMEDEEQGPQAGRTGRVAPITPEQLAAALAAAAGSANPFMGVTGLGLNQPGAERSSTSTASSSAQTTPSSRLTADMFQAAMQQAMQVMDGSNSAHSSAPTPVPQMDYSIQLATMKEMGIIDEGLATRALQVMGGDIQAAVDLIFSGWLGDEDAMQ